MAKLQFIWHMYHNKLLSATTMKAPITRRRIAIKHWKSPSEHAIRLRLLRKVKGTLPKRIVAAFKVSWKKGSRLVTESRIVKRLHKQECIKDCPWNGETIFPGQAV